MPSPIPPAPPAPPGTTYVRNRHDLTAANKVSRVFTWSGEKTVTVIETEPASGQTKIGFAGASIQMEVSANKHAWINVPPAFSAELNPVRRVGLYTSEATERIEMDSMFVRFTATAAQDSDDNDIDFAVTIYVN